MVLWSRYVLEASFRNADNVQEINQIVNKNKVDRSTYQAFQIKLIQVFLHQYYVQRFIDKVTMHLYLTPGFNKASKDIKLLFCKKNSRCRSLY